MIGALRTISDRVLGRGDSSITVPIFDGALKPNQRLEDAEVVAQLESAEDLAGDGGALLVADGDRVLRLADAGLREVARFDWQITALCALPDGGIAVALGGREIVVRPQTGGEHRSTGPSKPFSSQKRMPRGDVHPARDISSMLCMSDFLFPF